MIAMWSLNLVGACLVYASGHSRDDVTRPHDECSTSAPENSTEREVTCSLSPLGRRGFVVVTGDNKKITAGDNVTIQCSQGSSPRDVIHLTCSDGGVWLPHPPNCTDAPVSTVVPSDWRLVFSEHQEWAGSYHYEGEAFKFHFYILETSRNSPSEIHALCVSDTAKFHLRGFQQGNHTDFEISHLLKSGKHFIDTSWNVSGYVTREKGQWSYKGLIWSPSNAFTTLIMHPFTSPTGHVHETPGDDVSVEGSMTALLLGIIIAVVAILFAALLATFCVRKRKSQDGGTASTSFENPIYDYENNPTIRLEERCLDFQSSVD